LSAISYTANDVYISNDTVFRIEVDNAPLAAIFGTLSVNDSVVNDGSSILFTFSGNMLDLNVTFNDSELRKLDNYSGDVMLNDSGRNGDAAVDDAIYSGIYNIDSNNNVSDGEKILTAVVNDSANNVFLANVTITLDNTVPNASIQIFGTSVAGFTNVSTEYTVSRVVTLMTVFNDSVGLQSCRYANENQVYTGWESCITNRAWVLSDGAGNKTVILDVMDSAGNINTTNDTIYFNASGFGLDITPPLTPTVMDGGTYTNIDISLHAAWNTTDPESDLLHIPLEYEYRIKFNSVSNPSQSGYLNTTYTYVGISTEVNAHQLNLTDNHNYTFEIRAINTGGVRSGVGESDGIIVDISAPTLPEINSTHLEENWSSNRVVGFNWTAADGISNVSAFSYVLDANSTTIPDSIPEAETEHTTISTGYNDGQQSVLKLNQSGNASSVYVEIKQNLTAGDILRVTIQLAESHVETTEKIGVRVYAIGVVPTSFNMSANNVSEVLNFERDIAYVSDLRDATSYVADIQINTDVTSDRFFVAIEGSITDNDNNYNLLIAQSNVSYDASTISYYCTHGVSCVNTTNTTGYAITVAQRDLKADNVWDKGYTVGDGTFYFHVKAQDEAGNFGPVKHHQIRVDTSASSTPQMTEPEKETVSATFLNFSWTEATDPESGVDNYTLAVDNNSGFSSPEFYGWVNNQTNYTVTGLTADTTYYARVHSRNRAGVNSSWSDSVTTVIDTSAPVITLGKPSGKVISNEVTILLRTNERAECSGAEVPGVQSTFTFTNSTLHETRVTLSSGDGAKTFSVSCTDDVNNEVIDTLSIDVQTSAVVSSVTLQSPSVFTDDIVSTNVTVRDSSAAGLGEIPKGAFSLLIGQDALPFSLFDDGGGVYTLQFTAPQLNGSYEYSLGVTTGTTTVTGTSTLEVRDLLFIVQYTGAIVSASTATKMIYSITGNFSIGFASDSRSVDSSSTDEGLNLSANSKDGDVFVFVTRSSGSVERVGNLLKDRTFLDAVNPSFGYAIDQDTFVVFTDLGYDDIALTGNRTLNTGKFNLVIENKGFDSSVNKTKLEVRVN